MWDLNKCEHGCYVELCELGSKGLFELCFSPSSIGMFHFVHSFTHFIHLFRISLNISFLLPLLCYPVELFLCFLFLIDVTIMVFLIVIRIFSMLFLVFAIHVYVSSTHVLWFRLFWFLLICFIFYMQIGFSNKYGSFDNFRLLKVGMTIIYSVWDYSIYFGLFVDVFFTLMLEQLQD